MSNFPLVIQTVHSLKVVESHLMDGDKLTEVLNIEISQGVITSGKKKQSIG